MQQRRISFFSDGLRLDGDLYLPDDLAPGERRPGVITCSGYQGLKVIHPERFARALVPAGYVCLAFDYRGFGSSDGPRGRLVPQEQIEDVRAAITFLQAVPEVDPERIGLIGWALGGGVVIATAADDPRVRCVATLSAIADGARSVRFQHDEESWNRLLGHIEADRERRMRYGSSELVHPFEIVRLDGVTNEYVDDELYRAPGFGMDVTLESADFLNRFRPGLVVDRISPRPLLLIHGEDNALHSADESRDLYERAGEPKELMLLEGTGHTEWAFDDHPTFLHVAERIREFLAESLAGQVERAAGAV